MNILIVHIPIVNVDFVWPRSEDGNYEVSICMKSCVASTLATSVMEGRQVLD